VSEHAAHREVDARVSPYLSTADVAARLHCSTRTIHELTRTSAIPHRRLPGTRRCLFLPDELDAWADGAPLEVVELARGGRVVRTRDVRAHAENGASMRLVEGRGDSRSQGGA
jgi:excisionase family DNA binding protein